MVVAFQFVLGQPMLPRFNETAFKGIVKQIYNRKSDLKLSGRAFLGKSC